MPYLNSKGEWCGGVGSLGVHWGNATGAGTVIWGSGAGGAQWLDDDTIIAQDCSSGVCKLRTHNVRTGAEADVVGGAGGANDIRAGGGVWARWLAGSGVATSDPPNFSDVSAGIGNTVSRVDGAIPIKRVRNSGGGWEIHEKDGQIWTLTEGDAGDINLLGSRRAAWTEGGEPKTTANIPTPSPGSRPFWWLKMLETPKGWYVLYAMPDGRTVLHSVYSSSGYVVTTGDAFSPDMVVLSGNKIRIVWAPGAGETDVVVLDIDLVLELPTVPVGGTPPPPIEEGGAGGEFGIGTVILTSENTFPVAGAAEEMLQLPIDVFPSYPAEGGHGRIVHPTLGAFDYEVKPDEWLNIDADAIIPPVWSSTRTLTSAANVLWKGNIRDVVIEERWKALGGLSMPITQLRMLLAIWTTPVDPDVGYVQWFPNYITNVAFNVLPMMLTAGGQGVTFDDVVNYKDEDGNPIGWMTNPVVFTLKIVGRL